MSITNSNHKFSTEDIEYIYSKVKNYINSKEGKWYINNSEVEEAGVDNYLYKVCWNFYKRRGSEGARPSKNTVERIKWKVKKNETGNC